MSFDPKTCTYTFKLDDRAHAHLLYAEALTVDATDAVQQGRRDALEAVARMLDDMERTELAKAPRTSGARATSVGVLSAIDTLRIRADAIRIEWGLGDEEADNG